MSLFCAALACQFRFGAQRLQPFLHYTGVRGNEDSLPASLASL